jgi:hypothetical protein
MKVFVIRWGAYGYVAKTNANRKPYVRLPSEAKHWKTRKNAEKFLTLKDSVWARMCTVEEIELADR